MKATCKFNSLANLDNVTAERLKKYFGRSPMEALNLKLGESYNVYGILFRDNTPWFYICTHPDDESPTAYPYELFIVDDEGFPAHWRLSFQNNRGQLRTEIVFPEWANDSDFYENLIGSSPKEVAIFKNEKSPRSSD